MKQAFGKLVVDFLSTIAFLIVYAASGSVIIATVVAISVSIGQFVHARVTGQALSAMTAASLVLAVALGGATLLTDDPRFVLIKPSIAHFAVGAIMLHRGWMLRYLPPIVTTTIPQAVTVAGYGWAALMFALGAGVIAVALTGDIKLWGLYVGVVAIGAKLIAFFAQFAIFRLLVKRALTRDPSLRVKVGLPAAAESGSAA